NAFNRVSIASGNPPHEANYSYGRPLHTTANCPCDKWAPHPGAPITISLLAAANDRLRIVDRGLRLALDLLAAQILDHAGIRDREARSATRRDALITLALTDLRLRGAGAGAGDRLHLNLLHASHPHGHTIRARRCFDQHWGVERVLELQVDRALEDRGLAARRVAGNVVGVRRVGHVFHAREIGGVVQRGGELGNAAAHGFASLTIYDDAGLHETLLLAAWPGVAVQAEGLAWQDDSPVDHLRDAADIHARGCAKSVGREAADHVVEMGLRCLLGRVLGLLVLIEDLVLSVLLVQHLLAQVSQGFIPLDFHAVLVRDDLNVAALEVEARV